MSAKRRRILEIVTLGGCGLFLFAGCILIILIQALGFVVNAHNDHLSEWKALLNGKVNPKNLQECQVDWENPEGKLWTCGALVRPPKLMLGQPTAVIMATEPGGRVKSIVFNIRPDVMLPWHVVTAEKLINDTCEERYTPYSGATLWQCKSHAYALFSATIMNWDAEKGGLGDLAYFLVMARTVADFEEELSALIQGASQAQFQMTMAALDNDLLRGSSSAVDKSLVDGFHELLVGMDNVPTTDPEAMQKLTAFFIKSRDEIANEARELRRQARHAAPLPSQHGLVDVAFLMNRSQDEVRVLLGKPTSCRTMKLPSVGTYPRCSYGELYWTVEVSFIDRRSSRITLTFEQDILPMEEESLAQLDLPRRVPTTVSDDALTWAGIAGLKTLSITRQKTPRSTVVTASVR
ncbi:MAG: hypothetical protein ACNA8W_08455 [Bradymonadaceae bacterium]